MARHIKTKKGGMLSRAIDAKAKRKEKIESAAGTPKPKPKAKAKKESGIKQGDKTGKNPKSIKKKKPAVGKRELVALREKQRERAKKLKMKKRKG